MLPDTDPIPETAAELREELRAVEAELDALTARRTGFDLEREVIRLWGMLRSAVGIGDPDEAGYDAEHLSGTDLVERIQYLQRRRASLKTRLERVDYD